MMLFKKKVIQARMTDEEKDSTIRCWMLRERIGWIIVVIIQVFCVFFLLQFVRYYPWTVVQRWFLAALQSLIHRVFSAPAIRMTWIYLLLVNTRFHGNCDFCLVLQPDLMTFQTQFASPGIHLGETGPNAKKQQGQSSKKEEEEEEKDDDDDDGADFNDMGGD